MSDLAYGLGDILETIATSKAAMQDTDSSEESRLFWRGHHELLVSVSEQTDRPELAEDLRQRRDALKQAIRHQQYSSLAIAEMLGILHACRWLLGDWLVATDEEGRLRITHQSDVVFWNGWEVVGDARTYAEARDLARTMAIPFYEQQGWWIFWPDARTAIYDYADHIPEGAEPYFDVPYDSEAEVRAQLKDMKRHVPEIKLAREV